MFRLKTYASGRKGIWLDTTVHYQKSEVRGAVAYNVFFPCVVRPYRRPPLAPSVARCKLVKDLISVLSAIIHRPLRKGRNWL